MVQIAIYMRQRYANQVCKYKVIYLKSMQTFADVRNYCMSADFEIIQNRIVGAKRKNPIKPDAVYNNLHVSLLTNMLMKDGNKSVVYNKVVLPALQMIKDRKSEEPCQVLQDALDQARPSVELGRPFSGSHHQVPMNVKPARALSRGMKFIIHAATSIKGKKSTAEKLYEVLWDSANGRGAAVERKEGVHKAAAANNAFKAF